jgi:hypothetical protein
MVMSVGPPAGKAIISLMGWDGQAACARTAAAKGPTRVAATA